MSNLKVEIPAGPITLLAGSPVFEGNKDFVIFPLGRSVRLQPGLLSINLEFEVADFMELLLSPRARCHCDSFWMVVSLKLDTDPVFRIRSEVFEAWKFARGLVVKRSS